MNLEPIDTSTTAGKAEVMRLAASGRRLVHRTKGDALWWDCPEPNWGWQASDYAIIAEPVGPEVVWVEFDRHGGVLSAWSTDIGSGIPGRTTVRYVRGDQ